MAGNITCFSICEWTCSFYVALSQMGLSYFWMRSRESLCVCVCGGFKNNVTECFWQASFELSLLLFKCRTINVLSRLLCGSVMGLHAALPAHGAAGDVTVSLTMHLLGINVASVHWGRQSFGIHLGHHLMITLSAVLTGVFTQILNQCLINILLNVNSLVIGNPSLS